MGLTNKQAQEIKVLLSGGGLTQQQIAERYDVSRGTVSNIACGETWASVPWPNDRIETVVESLPLTADTLLPMVRKQRISAMDLAKRCNQPVDLVHAALERLQRQGHLLVRQGDFWSLEKTPDPSAAKPLVYESRGDGSYLFGFCGDTHLGSKYERLDVLDDLYDKFADAGVDRVFHAGNWIEGEARFNKYDIAVYGMDNQITYLAQHYPQRNGIVTYAVAGDDHEGWYGQREGIDIGKHAERIMREQGRDDWVHCGYMESFVTLRHALLGSSTKLLLMHPGGGSSYAYSYRPQKIVESFSGGEKPAVLLMGHYHKISHNVIRNVWAIQCGCTQDQTPFMRKKSIDAHVGGGICRLQQDGAGAIVGCQVQFFLYYNSGYYNNRWNHGGKVTLAKRV